MCADCHSTNLDKNFDPATDSYHTTWSEMNVSCEACHGPASEHLKWAEAHRNDPDQAGTFPGNLGLVLSLKEPEVGSWIIDPETGQPKRSTPLASTVQVETCARCHAHRTLLEEKFHSGQPFLDSYVSRPLSPTSSTTTTGRSTRRSMSTAPSCRARCITPVCAARTATIRTP